MNKTECKTGVGLFHRVGHSLISLLFYSDFRIVTGNTNQMIKHYTRGQNCTKTIHYFRLARKKNIR